MGKPRGYLSGYTILRTADLDEARASVSDRYCDHRLDLVRGTGLNACHNHVRGANTSLNVLGYGGDVAIAPGELTRFYLLQIPLAGAARIRHRGEEIESTPERATLINPDRDVKMEWRADCVKLMLQIDAAFLSEVAAGEIGMPLPGPVRFDPAVDLTGPAGRRLRATLTGAVAAVDAGALDLSRPSLSLLRAEREMVRLLLKVQPSNVSHLIGASAARITSVQVKRAIAFIHAHYIETLRLDDIARAAGVHPRTLQLGFRDEVGVSPMCYLKSVRLDVARYRLGRRRDRESVTDVAYGCGYSHLGRFAQDYRARFGMAPSAPPGG